MDPNSPDNSRFTRDDIRKFVINSEEPPTGDLDSRQELYVTIKKLLEGEAEAQALVEAIKKEEHFLKLAWEISYQNGFEIDYLLDRRDNDEKANPIDERMLGTEFLLLYDLFVNDGLERLYLNFIRNSGVKPTSFEESVAIKTELASRFLSRQQERLDEREADLDDPITMGFEIEFDPPEDFIVERYKGLYEYFTSKGFNLDWQIELDNPFFPEKCTEEDKALFLDFLQISKLLNGRFVLSGYDYKESHNIRFKNIQIKRGYEKLPKKVLIQQYEVEGAEMVSEPSLSVSRQLRELYTALANGGAGRDWNLHVTVGGVILDLNHTEIMDCLLMSAAAGFTPGNLLEGIIQQQENETYEDGAEIEWSQMSLIDRLPKRSYMMVGDDGGDYSFPFHKVRGRTAIKRYPNDNRTSDFVEVRGLLRYDAADFPKMVRYFDFLHKSSVAIHAFQKPLEQRTIWDQQLAECWESLRAQMWEKFQGFDIPIAQQDQYYEQYVDFKEFKSRPESLEYNYMLTELQLQSTITNPRLQDESRALVREFKKRVKQILKEKKSSKVKYVSY